MVMGSRGTQQPPPTCKADIIERLKQVDARRRHARDTGDLVAEAEAQTESDDLLQLLSDFMRAEERADREAA